MLHCSQIQLGAVFTIHSEMEKLTPTQRLVHTQGLTLGLHSNDLNALFTLLGYAYLQHFKSF